MLLGMWIRFGHSMKIETENVSSPRMQCCVGSILRIA